MKPVIAGSGAEDERNPTGWNISPRIRIYFSSYNEKFPFIKIKINIWNRTGEKWKCKKCVNLSWKILSIFLFNSLKKQDCKTKKIEFSSRINKRKAISLFAIVYASSARPQSDERTHAEICFDFHPLWKLFAFMINYKIPLKFYISPEKGGKEKSFLFMKYLSEKRAQNFPISSFAIQWHSFFVFDERCFSNFALLRVLESVRNTFRDISI